MYRGETALHTNAKAAWSLISSRFATMCQISRGYLVKMVDDMRAEVADVCSLLGIEGRELEAWPP